MKVQLTKKYVGKLGDSEEEFIQSVKENQEIE